VLASVTALALAACGSSSKSSSVRQATPSTPPTPSTPSTTTTAAAVQGGGSKHQAAVAYKAAFNTMARVDNKGIDLQNANDPATIEKGIGQRIAARQAFDTAVLAIRFPDADKASAQAVVTADAQFIATLKLLESQASDTSAFNKTFRGPYTQEKAAFKAADAKLSTELGLTH
jgi:hypothetical protein